VPIWKEPEQTDTSRHTSLDLPGTSVNMTRVDNSRRPETLICRSQRQNLVVSLTRIHANCQLAVNTGSINPVPIQNAAQSLDGAIGLACGIRTKSDTPIDDHRGLILTHSG
jgi:hypothetical protein